MVAKSKIRVEREIVFHNGKHGGGSSFSLLFFYREDRNKDD